MAQDLAALAAQFGGKPVEQEQDLVALAKQFGGSVQEAPKQATKPEGKSITGFLSNAVSSTGRLIKDTAVGTAHMAKEAGRAISGQDPTVLFRAAQAAPGAIKEHVTSRYGSLDKLGETAYNDPAGLLSDLSAVLSLGAGAAAKAPKIAGVLRKAEGAINPIRVAEPAAKAVEYGTAAAVRPMTKPPKSIRRQGGILEPERVAMKTGAFTEGRAATKQAASSKRATEMAENATATTPRSKLTDMPKSLEQVGKGLDHEGDLAALAEVERKAVDSLPEQVAARDLLDKRRYLDRQLDDAFRAKERHGAPTGVKQTGQQEMLGNIRGELRKVAPDIKAVDDQTRALGLVRGMLEEAGLRAGDIPMGAGLLGGGLALGGVPGAGVAGALFGAGRTFPQVPLALGSVPVRGAAAAASATANPGARQGMLLAALLERLGNQDH